MFGRDEVHVKSMPANFEWDTDLQATEWDWREATDLNDIEFTVAPSEDFWKRFEELPELGEDLESFFDYNAAAAAGMSDGMVRNHDCMWAGTCLNQEHRNYPTASGTSTSVEPCTTAAGRAPSDTVSPVKREPKKRGVIIQKTVGRSLLINSRNRQQPPRPETPPSLSESEEDKGINTTTTMPHYMHGMSIVKYEHDYDKQVRTDDLGVQTPSDSEEEEEEEESTDERIVQEESEEEEEEEEDDEEEEIDVVSLARESLPTNPSRQARFELQQKMASAISTNTLISASRAVSRRLNVKKPKRKRRKSDTEEEPDEYTEVVRRKWRSPKKSRFPTDCEPDSTEKRSLHNNMERMRRGEMKNAFDDLRGLVPSLCSNSKAAKVTILKDATSYLHELNLKDRTLQMQVAELRSDQERLRTTLSRLRRSLAVIRR